jgi:hypothetical protein
MNSTYLRRIACAILLSVVSPVLCEAQPSEWQRFLFLGRLGASNNRAEHWLVNNVKSNGLFRYKYSPVTDEYPNTNNAIRQLMGSRLLAEMVHEKPDYLDLHRKNLDFHMRNWYRERGELEYVYYSGKSKLGANAMLLRTLVWSPDFDLYETQARKLVAGILHLMDERGAFRPWFIAPYYEYDADYLLTFYSGEALVALIEYYQKTNDPEAMEAALKAQDFYIHRYVDQMEEHYYPAYVPWHSIALNKLYKITREEKYVDALFAMNDKLLELQDRTREVGRFYNPDTPQYGGPHASSDGVYTEGLTYAYEIALLTGDKAHEWTYWKALSLAVPNLLKLQYKVRNSARYKRPDRIIGSFRYSVGDSGIRVDTTQHTMDAYRTIQEVLGQRVPVKF